VRCLPARLCKVNRLGDQRGLCAIGRQAVIASHFPHFGEDSCLRGRNGSGTIFFSGCNLRCVFCQNYDISWQVHGEPVTPSRLAAMMLALQDRGCHNINFVTPGHVGPQILEALPRPSKTGCGCRSARSSWSIGLVREPRPIDHYGRLVTHFRGTTGCWLALPGQGQEPQQVCCRARWAGHLVFGFLHSFLPYLPEDAGRGRGRDHPDGLGGMAVVGQPRQQAGGQV